MEQSVYFEETYFKVVVNFFFTAKHHTWYIIQTVLILLSKQSKKLYSWFFVRHMTNCAVFMNAEVWFCSEADGSKIWLGNFDMTGILNLDDTYRPTFRPQLDRPMGETPKTPHGQSTRPSGSQEVGFKVLKKLLGWRTVAGRLWSTDHVRLLALAIPLFSFVLNTFATIVAVSGGH